MDTPPQPLRPLSQLSFRLSQQPSAARRALCRQLSRADSIEDDPPSDGAAAGPLIEDYASSDGDGGAAAGLATQWTASSPILTLGSTSSTARGTPAQQRPQPPLRTISRHRQYTSLQSASPGRPLLSQRPAHWAAAPPALCGDQTPSKRPRRMGAAAAELVAAAAREVSDFCMWHHCLSGSSDAPLVCRQPTSGVRLRLLAAQSVLGTHLFSAQATVIEVLADDAQLAGMAGQPLAVLLSFAVAQDAAPHAAAQMAARIEALARGAAAGPVVVAVHRPWRIQGTGDKPCLLASRFVVE